MQFSKSDIHSLPYALYSAEQVRALDRNAIEQHAIPGYELMQRAGLAAFRHLCTCWPKARRLLVLAGAGNNGGDGYVMARLAQEQGWPVRLQSLGDHSALHGEAAEAAAAFVAAGGAVEPFRRLPPDVDLIVDALLGTGLERPVTGIWAWQCGAGGSNREFYRLEARYVYRAWAGSLWSDPLRIPACTRRRVC